MTNFKIGDVVRLKTDGPDTLPLIVKEFGGDGKWAYCESKCLNMRGWEKLGDIELVRSLDPQPDIVQAIREVLLGDEFPKAFAAAWMKTPLPLAMHFDDKDGERIKSLADYPFGEPSEGLAIAPITGSESEAYYLDKLKKGEEK